ncbi:Os02g0830300 [Oryza sativa Japonica Group]|uniref:Os02g0830300 protein n=1 Tax=Oryza sativa subsp. japonica TaxID=39947 RepID=A0A0P0VRS2_ORYSJ|nr:hypothetical protein EE612_014648 [Oryza sativa]BAS81742.1 Os02g0830300 [Oryza sativa Japonica Group]
MAADDPSVGFFSGVWSRLRAAWRRTGAAHHPAGPGDDDDGQNEETVVRSRLVRRAAAARRLAHKLAFLSFNLEVLVFVYAFWRARRRNLSWRQPIQALPVLVIPALATLIYAAFIRFTRRLDLKDHRRLKRIQEQKQANDGEPRKPNQNDLISAQKQNCGDVDDASNSLPATDSNSTFLPATHSENRTSKPKKRRQPSISSRGDGEADMSWGHSKDFQPMPLDGLRKRRFSSEKTYRTTSIATESIEEDTQNTMSSSVAGSICGKEFPELSDSSISQSNNIKPICGSSAPLIGYPGILLRDGNEEVPAASTHLDQQGGAHDPIEDTVFSPLDYRNHSGPVIFVKLTEPPTIHHESPVGGGEDKVFDRLLDIVNTNFSSCKENLICPVNSHDSSFDRGDSCLTEHGMSSLMTVFREMPVKVSEESSPSQPEKLESYPVSINEPPASPSDYIVAYGSLNDVSQDPSDPVLSALENFEQVPPEGGKEDSLLEPHKLTALQTDTVTPEKVPTSHAIDDNEVIINPDEVTNALACICTDANIIAAVADIDTGVSPRLNLPAFQESHCEEFEDPEVRFSSSAELAMKGDEDTWEKEPCGFNGQEGNDVFICSEEEALLGPLAVSTTEQYMKTSGFPLCCQDANMMEIPRIVAVNPELNNPTSGELLTDSDEVSKEELSYDLHLKEPNSLPFDLEKEDFMDPPVVDISEHSNPAHFVPDTNVRKKIQGGQEKTQEAFSNQLDQITCNFEGILLSSGEINNDVFYSSSSSSYLLRASAAEDNAPSSVQGRFSESEDGKTSAFLDNPIFLDEVTRAENWTNNTGSSQCISDRHEIRSFHDGKQVPSETIQGLTLGVEGSFVSPEESINSEKYSLYSRSSSCVSEVNIMHATGGGALAEPGNNQNFNLDDKNTMMFQSVNSTENYGNNRSVEFIPETNMIETLEVAGESIDGLLHEVSSNVVNAFVTPDTGNDMGKSDDYLDLPSFSSVHTVQNSKAENNPYKTTSSLFSADVNLTGCLGSGQQGNQQGEETALCFENLYMALQDDNSKDHFTNLGSQDIPDASSFKLQDEHTMTPISRNKVDIAEKSTCYVAGESMVADLQDTNKTPSDPRDGSISSFSGACNLLDESKYSTDHPYYSRSMSSGPECSLIETPEAARGESVETDDENFSFEETLTPEISSNRSASYNCTEEAVRSSGKGSTDPLMVDVHSFDMIPAGEERENETLNEIAYNSEQAAIITEDVKYTESFLNKPGSLPYAPNDNCPIATENFDKGFSEPQYQDGPEVAVRLAGMPLFVDNGTEAEKSHDNTRCSSSSHSELNITEAVQELSIDVGNKVSPKGSELPDWHRMDKEAKDSRLDDVKEDLEDLDEDHENSPIDPPKVAGITPSLAPTPSLKLYAQDASWRDSSMGVSNDFEVARAAGLRQRKQVFTISSGTGSGTMSELTDTQYTELVDDVIDSLNAPLPSSAVINTKKGPNGMAAYFLEQSATEQPRKNI